MPSPYFPTNQSDFFSPRVWTDTLRDVLPPGDARGFTYLPRRSVGAGQIRWEVMKAARPMAPFVAINAETPTLPMNDVLTEAWADELFIRVKDRLNQSDVRVIRNFGDSPVSSLGGQMAAASKGRIADRFMLLNDAVRNRIEWLQMHALQGRVTVTPDVANWNTNDLSFDIVYPVNTATPSVNWDTTATADPIVDFATWFRDTWKLGYKIAKVIMTPAAIWNLQLNTKLRQMAYVNTRVGAGALPGILPAPAVVDMLQGAWGIEIDVYRFSYTTDSDDGTTITRSNTQILPDNVAIFLPDTPVGFTAETPAPPPFFNYDGGIFTWKRDPVEDPSARDPYVYEHGVGWYGMPVLQWPNRVTVATLW